MIDRSKLGLDLKEEYTWPYDDMGTFVDAPSVNAVHMETVKQLYKEHSKLSVSFLQRKLRITHAQAKLLLDYFYKLNGY